MPEIAPAAAKFADLDLPVSALYLLAAPSTPDTAVVAVASRAGKGNGLSVADVKDIILNARRNSPLCYLMNTARRILNEAKNAADVERIMDELADDYAVCRVAYVLHWKCEDRVSRLEERVRKLQLEIERLELINNVCDQLSSRIEHDFERDDGSIIIKLLNRQRAPAAALRAMTGSRR